MLKSSEMKGDERIRCLDDFQRRELFANLQYPVDDHHVSNDGCILLGRNCVKSDDEHYSLKSKQRVMIDVMLLTSSLIVSRLGRSKD